MTTKRTILATLFVSAVALTSSVQAQESHVEKLLTSMVNQAMETASVEIAEEVQKSIFTSAYNFSFAKAVDPSAPATKVTITDIASVKSDKTQLNLIEKSDD